MSTTAEKLLNDLKNNKAPNDEKGKMTIKGTKGSRKTRAKQSAESKTLAYKIRLGEVEIEKFQAISETLEQIAKNVAQFVLENGIPANYFYERPLHTVRF